MAAQTEFSVVYITANNREEALEISHVLLSERLIACANLHENVTSLYRWLGEIERAQEVVIFAKTQSIHVPRIVERVKAMHSYEKPCITSFPITDGCADYLKWIETETTSK